MALYHQAREAHRRQLVCGLPFRNMVDGGKPSFIGDQKCKPGFSAVSLRTCGPLALIPVNGKKTKSGGKIRAEKGLQCATLGSPGGDLIE